MPYSLNSPSPGNLSSRADLKGPFYLSQCNQPGGILSSKCRRAHSHLSTLAINSISADAIAALLCGSLSVAPASRRINCKIILATSDFIACRWPGKISSPSKKVYEKIIFANYCIGGGGVRIRAGGCFYWRHNKHTTRDTQPGNKIHEVKIGA